MKRISVWMVAVLAAGYIFATPYLTVYQMKIAAENHDGEALSEYIDFPPLRQSLKDQMNAMLGKKMVEEVANDDPFTALGATLGATFGGVIVEKMIDAYITPASVMELMKGEKPTPERAGKPTERQEPFANVSMSYESFSKFSVITKQHESDDEVKFIFRRNGMEWKLTEILLPSFDF